MVGDVLCCGLTLTMHFSLLLGGKYNVVIVSKNTTYELKMNVNERIISNLGVLSRSAHIDMSRNISVSSTVSSSKHTCSLSIARLVETLLECSITTADRIEINFSKLFFFARTFVLFFCFFFRHFQTFRLKQKKGSLNNSQWTYDMQTHLFCGHFSYFGVIPEFSDSSGKNLFICFTLFTNHRHCTMAHPNWKQFALTCRNLSGFFFVLLFILFSVLMSYVLFFTIHIIWSM